jgi:putative membrane protein
MRASPLRMLPLGLGAMTLAAGWLGAFSLLFAGPFAAHMMLHMAVVAIAAPLLALGVAGTPFDPVPRAPRLLHPVLASVVELLLVWGWHTPALHHAARSSALGFVLEQASFLGSGLWLWLSAFGGGQAQRAERDGAGIVALLLTCMHMTLLGALLALPPRPLYTHAHDESPSGPGHARGMHAAPSAPIDAAGAVAFSGAALAAGPTPLEDQHLGGALMILVGGASYLAGGLWLAVALLRRHVGAPSRAGAGGHPAARSEVGIEAGGP